MKISKNDNREYSYLTLKNGLRVLLIQDQYTEKSAAALTVNVGHFDDPKDREGLAHFLEHMVFLGTKSQPEAGYFSKFINQAGGNSNAWTGSEHSNYYFDCNNKNFINALALFSDFFICPLFDSKLAQSERTVIESEFQMKIKDDGKRIHQVSKETVNPEHPFAKFSVGNKHTLRDKGCCISEEVKSFFQDQYLAQWMTLVVASPMAINDIEKTVTSLFSAINGNKKVKPTIELPLYRQEEKGLMVHIEPRKHMQKLIISFAMENTSKLYKSKSSNFIAHLLGYEGEGSLYSILKKKGWINALYAGGGISGSNYKDFTISVTLTDLGVAHYQDIVTAFFEYSSLIKNNIVHLPRLYQDKKTLLTIAFDNQEATRLLEWVSHLSVNMHYYEKSDILFGDYMMSGFDENIHMDLCRAFSSDNMRIVFIHPDVKPQKQTKFYHTPYAVDKIPNRWLKQLASINEPQPDMRLPEPNPYLDIKNTLYDIENKQGIPTLLKDKPGFAFWFKQDATFRVNKGHFYIEIDSLMAVDSNKHMALTRLFTDLIMDAVAERFYLAELAGLNYHIDSHQGGLTIQTSGLAANQIKLILQLLDAVINQNITISRFTEYKTQLKRHWENHNENKPLGELFSFLGAKLMPWNPNPIDLSNGLKNLSFDEFSCYRAQFFNSIHIKAFLHGNWQHCHAVELQKAIRERFKKSEILNDLKRPLITLDDHSTHRLIKEHTDYAFLEYIQASSNDVFEKISIMMFNQLINQEYFETLRTKQQLGYLVGAGYAPFNTRAGIAFYIQSPDFESDFLLQQHDKFMNDFIFQLKHLSKQQWDEHKAALRSQIAEKDKNLRLRSQRFWIAITNDDFNFDMQKRLIGALEYLSKTEFIKFIIPFYTSNACKITLTCN